MKSTRITAPQIALAAGLMAALCPLAPARAAPDAAAQQEVARLEEAYSQSFVTGDVSIAQRLVAEDFVGCEPDGKTSDKAAILADVRSEPRATSLKITALTVRLHGDTAIALGSEEDAYAGATAPTHRRWLDTWRNTADGWRLVASAEVLVKP
ncbi:nuclear transport factor 2 family protein [Phenylobacterium montanum]|uniref:Nuclear transport factor 2 family protein n=1 Tax=Phenylobacterium montanum TaxID=2823693 RepID=A0A975FYF0_9CAUL|nr:nuclear transport factor 2 family protein [Caulobacter sp. S6]QUD86591.1 nuclear transport factor 2 family protein [Caulobacter sp. S6]